MLERDRVLSPILGDLHARLDEAKADGAARGRPFVTLAYAQSLDGSIAGQGGRPLSLSGPSSLQLTHELRAAHDAILVGIGTVLSDNPRLNVRLVAGLDPQPIVVDSRLRLPEAAHLMESGRGTWLAVTFAEDPPPAVTLLLMGHRLNGLVRVENARRSLRYPLTRRQIRKLGPLFGVRAIPAGWIKTSGSRWFGGEVAAD